MWHVFICRVYSGVGRARQKIWTHIEPKKEHALISSLSLDLFLIGK